MKSLMKLAALLSVSLLLAGCAGRLNTSAAQLHRKWMLINFKNYRKEDLARAKAYMDLSVNSAKKAKFGAFMGCNRMFFDADFKPNGTVKFSGVGSTMMYCDGMMDLEAHFAGALPKMKKYKIDGQFLTLSAADGEMMRFVAEDWD